MNLRFVEAFHWVATLLLDRRDKQFRLTVAGTRFMTYAQKLLELQREVKAEMGSGQDLVASLRIGAIESVLHSWLIPWIEKLRAEQPGLALELTVETTPVLMDQARRGAQDIVFAALPAGGEGVRNKTLPPMPMAFVGQTAQHRKRAYTLAELARGELLTFQRGSQPHVALLDALRQAKVENKRVHTISSISAMVQLVQGGFGVATLPLAAANRFVEVQGLRVLKCDVQLPPLPIHASYRSDPTTGLAEKALKSALAFM